MKYIKTYEKKDDLKIRDLKKGDFVVINSSDFGYQNALVYLTENPERNSDGFTIRATKWDENLYHAPITFYDWEILYKLETKKEIEEFKFQDEVRKYNL